MIIYKSNKKAFIEDVKFNRIDDLIQEGFRKCFARENSNYSEIASWRNSLPKMRDVIDTESIPDECGIAIEYKIPMTKKRIDFLITGYNENKKVVSIVELKQWEKVDYDYSKTDYVKTFVGKAERSVLHPSYQVYSYKYILQDFFENIYKSNNFNLNAISYLHNYDINRYPAILDIICSYAKHTQMFFKNDVEKFQKYLSTNFTKGDNGKIIEEIETSRIKPSKSVQKFVKEIIDNNDLFELIEDQKEYFEDILYYAKKAFKTKTKIVYILQGGPGTGKTLLALKLLSAFFRNDMNSVYVSKNQSLRETYKQIIIKNNKGKKYTKARIEPWFKGSSAFTELKSNVYDAIITDEAHRLNKRSQYLKSKYENQIREIICASYFSLFLVDEKQIVDMRDIGTVSEIKAQALAEGVLPENIISGNKLSFQLRNGGLGDFITYIENVLYNENEYFDINFINKYDFKLFDKFNDFYKSMKFINTNNNARIVSGYTRNWVSKKDKTKYDFDIDGIKMQWNLNGDSIFMVNSSSFQQIGSIHTVQGLETDYIGVIIGKDLQSDLINIKTDWTKRAKTDHTKKGLVKLTKENNAEALQKIDMIIRNTYKVLLTRGIKGCYVYCEDENVLKLFKQKLYA